MNQITVSGRVSKEISIKGKVGYFTLANDRDYPFNKDQNGNKVNNYLTCKVLGEKSIQRVQKYLTKRTSIMVTGHYFKDSWKDSNGQYQEFNYILVEKWEFQTGKANAESDEQQTSTPTEQPESTDSPQSNEQPSAPDDSFMSIPDDVDLEGELPFR